MGTATPDKQHVALSLEADKETVPVKPPKTFTWRTTALKRVLFMDVDPLIHHGYRTRLEPQDMNHERSVRTEHLTSLFEPAMEQQKERQAKELGEDTAKLAELDAKLLASGQTIPPTPTPAPEGPPARGGPPGGPPAKKAKKAEKRDEPKLSKEQQQRVKLQIKIDKETKVIDLKRVVLAGNARVIIITGILYLIGQACSLAGPLLLQRIVGGLQCQPFIGLPGVSCPERTTLYYYCLGLFLAPAIQSLCENHQQYMLYLAGTRMRNSLMAAIYRKCLRLSNSSIQEESTGRVVTLMSNDAQKLQDAMIAIHALWGSPAYIIAVLVLLWFQVGWATFVGLAVMMLVAPASSKLAAKLGGLRREILKWTDKRVGYMNEVISGIQMIKFYAWEKPFTARVQSARSQEARILRTTAAWQGVFGMLLFSGPVLVAICCFGAWTLAGNDLTNSKAYTALALFSLLRFPMSFLPMLITMIVNALVALKRIGGFLNREESALSKEVLDLNYPTGQVDVNNGEFTWDTSLAKSTISDIELHAKPGSLTMIVGGVGSGKSSVLGALVGHMNKVKGTCKVGGRVAYVAQTAWIMNDTLQENVLLGDDPLDPVRYQTALKVSQLGPDLDILPNGDLTEIGDRGVTLSGGQKQRVSIARAVYSDADVFLLDDPLSAVDSHVGRALFEDCIRGVLKDKTVVLVTNALQYLPQATNVLWMEGGRIRAQGTYEQLVQQGLNIAELQMGEDSEGEEEPTAGKTADGPATNGEAKHDAAGKDGAVVTTPASKVRASAERKRRSAEKRRSVEKKAKDLLFANSKSVTLMRGQTGANKNLTGVEERMAGNISWDVVKRYVVAGGGLPVLLSLVVIYALEQGVRVYTDRWLGIWASNQFNQSLGFYLGLYFALGVAYGGIVFVRSLRFLFMCVDAAVSLHNQLLGHILRLPKTFFDTNPSGRILNRFSRDTDIMDATLPGSLVQFVGCVATYISILIVISVATKWFAIALVPLTLVYFVIQRYYIPSARELQRIESVTRSPIYSKFAEALLGVSTIRAYRKEEHFTQVSDKLMEENAFAFTTQKLAASWLAMRLDILGLIVLTGCGVLVIQGNVSPSLAGLALVYALDLTRFLKHGTNMASKSEADFNSVERIVQYLRPETEAPPDTDPEVLKIMPSPWPSLGTIEVDDLSMRYRPELPLVLKGISFRVEGGEKVGLVGRTGSGKSSILLALFRMVEPSGGAIFIDGMNILTLGVQHLRSKMSIIPQDPFMFSGTVRTNLDPFEEHHDDRLWEVLAAVGLKPVIRDLEGKLDAKVVDNGANFSLGQRQLFCLARAMLRNSHILMLDEATASIDPDTDAQLQTAIRDVFAHTTMLTIAHRLNTIMDSDRVIVLEQGKVVETGHADELLQTDEGLFTRMVSQTGRKSARYLRSLASMARMAQQTGARTGSMFSGARTDMSFGAGGRSFGTVLRTGPVPSLGAAPYLVLDEEEEEAAADTSGEDDAQLTSKAPRGAKAVTFSAGTHALDDVEEGSSGSPSSSDLAPSSAVAPTSQDAPGSDSEITAAADHPGSRSSEEHPTSGANSAASPAQTPGQTPPPAPATSSHDSHAQP